MTFLNTYEKDFFKWANDQSNLLKNEDFKKLDIENLVEEIDGLGISAKTSLKSQLARLLMHQLKLKYQPEKQIDSRSWLNSILDAKRQIKYILQDSPSLKNELKKVFKKVYEDARIDAILETGLSEKIFPKECPWDLNEIFPELKKNIGRKERN